MFKPGTIISKKKQRMDQSVRRNIIVSLCYLCRRWTSQYDHFVLYVISRYAEKCGSIDCLLV